MTSPSFNRKQVKIRMEHNMKADCLMGKVAVITGGSMGLGRTILEKYIEYGAKCVICARNADALEQTRREIKARYECDIHTITADVSDRNDARRVIGQTIKEFGRLDILVNNAGVHGAKGEFAEADPDEWELAINVNLIGTVNMMREAIRVMKKSGCGKIINISGGGATGPRPYFSAYAVSKAAVVRLTETVAKEVEPYNICINAIAPGAMNTRLCEDIISAGNAVGKEYEDAMARKQNGGDSMERPAELSVFLASCEADKITGRLISAKWDKWNILPDHTDELAKSDVYTLRRVTARDRGYDWDV